MISNDVITSHCPHCKGKLEFQIRERPMLNKEATLQSGERRRVELSIVTVTKGGDRALPFIKAMGENASRLGAEFVVGVDSGGDLTVADKLHDYCPNIVLVQSKGYIESVLNTVVSMAKGNWILRLDDDEAMSQALYRWLLYRQYLPHHIWNIPTIALWGSPNEFITTPPLWPDPHPRLHTWSQVGEWGTDVHAASPWIGEYAPVGILHYKYLIKDYEERRAIADHYDSIREGAGTGPHMPFTLPEDHFDTVTVLPVGKGYFPNPMQYRDQGRRVSLKP